MIDIALFLALALAVQNSANAPDVSPHREDFIQVNGVKLHHLDWGGKGEPLVLLTGYGPTAHTFDDLAPHLTDRFRVVAFTRRGRTPSDQPRSGYDLETLVADLEAFVRALGLRRIHLAGHSFGGTEMTEFAVRHPEQVASLVYFDAAIYPVTATAIMKEAPVPPPQAPPGSPFAQVNAWWASYAPDFSKVRAPALAFYAIQERNPAQPANASEDLRQRDEVFWRTKWIPMVRAMAERFRREVPGSRVVVFENTGHYLFRERRDDVLREMERFYASVLVDAPRR